MWREQHTEGDEGYGGEACETGTEKKADKII